MNSELANVSTREEERVDHIGISSKRQARAEQVRNKGGRVIHWLQHRIGKRWRKDTFDQIVRCLAAAAVTERDMFVAQIKFMLPRLPRSLDLANHLSDLI